VDEPFDTVAKGLSKDKEGGFKGIIYIPEKFNINRPNQYNISYLYVERPGEMKKDFINHRMTSLTNKLRMQQMHITDEQAEQMQQDVKVDFNSLGNKKEKEGYTEAASAVGFIMGFAIYISLFFYGIMIMKGVMEEKTNRVVEVLTSSVKPFQLLMGKIVGVGAVGLTQFVLWILLTGVVFMLTPMILGHQLSHHYSNVGPVVQSSNIDPDDLQTVLQNVVSLPFLRILSLFPIYFIGGFLLYGSLFAAVGAAMGEDGDQQALTLPITVPIIISFYIAINVINNPDGKLGFFGSIIPFTSPVVMSVLLPFGPPWWQVLISVALLIGGFIFTTWIAARIYRAGILMYGKKIKLKEIGRWIFAKQ
jgi:ABC-2 type transport system permease protein